MESAEALLNARMAGQALMNVVQPDGRDNRGRDARVEVWC
jgi:hypothetical protein